MRIKLTAVFGFIIFLISGIVLPANYVDAQSTDWNSYLLFQTDQEASYPVLTYDTYGILHVFWRVADIGLQKAHIDAIYHAEYKNGQWSNPGDVLVSPDGGSIYGIEVASDALGNLHVIWHGNNSLLYFSSVDGLKASEPKAWSKPIVLGESWIHSGITVDQHDYIHVVFAGDNANRLYYTMSRNAGMGWTNPALIRESVDMLSGIDYTKIAVDSEDQLHVVWSEFKLPQGWPPTGVYYARSDGGGYEWSEPIQLAGANYDQINIIIGPDDLIHTAWNGMIGVGGRYHAFSNDHGNGWSQEIQVVPEGKAGTTGIPDMAFDSLGSLHFVSALDGLDGIQYATFNGNQWASTIEISPAHETQGEIKSVEYPRLAVGENDQLAVVYELNFQYIYVLINGDDIFLESPSTTVEYKPTEVNDQSGTGISLNATPQPDFGEIKEIHNSAFAVLLSFIVGIVFVGFVVIRRVNLK